MQTPRIIEKPTIRYRHIKKAVKDWPRSSIDATEGRHHQNFPSTLSLEVRNFISSLSGRCGDFQPDFDEIHLLCSYTKLSAYEEYVTNMKEQHRPYATRPYFERVWRQNFPNIKIRKFQIFSKCQECTNFREALSAKLTKEARLVILEQTRVHPKLQEIGREKYYKHRSKSRTNPSGCVSITFDNMDSGTTNLQRFQECFKNESTLSYIHHHVTGVLNHGRNKSYICTWTDEFSSDCNITLNCLMTVLEDVAKVKPEIQIFHFS